MKLRTVSVLQARDQITRILKAHFLQFAMVLQRNIPVAQLVKQAGLDEEPCLPHHLRDLFERPERCEVLPQDLAAVQSFMVNNLNA